MRRLAAPMFVLMISAGIACWPSAQALSEDKPNFDKREDPEATRLLAEARSARVTWEAFPGFAADAKVNLDGKVGSGKIKVDARGKVHLDLPDEMASQWARRLLASVVGHRLPGGEQTTPCFFPDNDEKNPLGRAIQAVQDEFHSSYRIRDAQIVVVNRTAKDVRFTITVMENLVNAEKHFLPAHYVVNSWDVKSGHLLRSETYRHTWQRVGGLDLPRSVIIVTASANKLDARELTLSNLQVNGSNQ